MKAGDYKRESGGIKADRRWVTGGERGNVSDQRKFTQGWHEGATLGRGRQPLRVRTRIVSRIASLASLLFVVTVVEAGRELSVRIAGGMTRASFSLSSPGKVGWEGSMAKYGKKAGNEVKNAMRRAEEGHAEERPVGKDRQEPQAGHRDWALEGTQERGEGAGPIRQVDRMEERGRQTVRPRHSVRSCHLERSPRVTFWHWSAGRPSWGRPH